MNKSNHQLNHKLHRVHLKSNWRKGSWKGFLSPHHGKKRGLGSATNLWFENSVVHSRLRLAWETWAHKTPEARGAVGQGKVRRSVLPDGAKTLQIHQIWPGLKLPASFTPHWLALRLPCRKVEGQEHKSWGRGGEERRGGKGMNGRKEVVARA